MVRKDLSRTDAALHESRQLESVLRREKKSQDATRYIGVDEAKSGSSVYQVESSRDTTRVLFISTDESLLNPTTQSLDGYTNLSDLFAEVHILIMREGIAPKNPVLRVADNMWLYTVGNKDWWRTPFPAVELCENQLVFADGFRPDIIVARDPFESALVAWYLGRKYKRPVQVHVLEDYTTVGFLRKNRHNRWRRRIPRFILARIKSVRTSTRALMEGIQKKYAITDSAVLPRLNNYDALLSLPRTLDLHTKYRSFVFIMVYVGALTHESKLGEVLRTAQFGLRDPRIGLVVVGSGPAQQEFAEQAKLLGISEQVVFETKDTDSTSYLSAADVLIVPEVDTASEELVLKAATLGVTIVAARTSARSDIFVHGQSALLYDEDDSDACTIHLNTLFNNPVARKQIGTVAQEVLRQRFHDDKALYRTAYRETIEEVLFLDENSSSTS